MPTDSEYGGGPYGGVGGTDETSGSSGTASSGGSEGPLYGLSPYGVVVSVFGAGAAAEATVLDVEGGDVLPIYGSGFRWPVEVLFLDEAYALAGKGYLFDQEFDFSDQTLYAGTPALAEGLYHLQVLSGQSQVPSDILENAVAYKRFAEELKVHTHRAKWSALWRVGPKWLRNV